MPKFTIASVPESAGLADYVDQDVALWPTAGLTDYETQRGDAQGVPARVYILDPDAGPVDSGELVLFQTVVRKQLDAHYAGGGGWFVCRVDQSKRYFQLVPPGAAGLKVADALPDEPAGLVAATDDDDHALKPAATS